MIVKPVVLKLASMIDPRLAIGVFLLCSSHIERVIVTLLILGYFSYSLLILGIVQTLVILFVVTNYRIRVRGLDSTSLIVGSESILPGDDIFSRLDRVAKKYLVKAINRLSTVNIALFDKLAGVCRRIRGEPRITVREIFIVDED